MVLKWAAATHLLAGLLFGLGLLAGCGDNLPSEGRGPSDQGPPEVGGEIRDAGAQGEADTSVSADAEGLDEGVNATDLVLFDDLLRLGAVWRPADVPGAPPSDLSIDPSEPFAGSAALRIDVPPRDEFPPGPAFGGIVIELASPTDLSSFDAIRFAARSEGAQPVLNLRLESEEGSGFNQLSPLSQSWRTSTRAFVNAPRATRVRRLVLLVEAGASPSSVYLDELRFVAAGGTSVPSYRFSRQPPLTVGASSRLRPIATFPESGDSPFDASLFDELRTSDPAVVTVMAATGELQAVGAGVAQITGRIGPTVSSPLLVTVLEDGVGVGRAPSAPPAPPTYPAGEVLSVYSDVYVDLLSSFAAASINAVSSAGQIQIAGDNIRTTTHLGLQPRDIAVAEFVLASELDVRPWTSIAFDLFADFDAAEFRVGLIGVGPDGVLNTADDESLMASLPGIEENRWNHVELRLADLDGNASGENIRAVGVAAGNVFMSHPDFRMHIDNVLLLR